MELVDASMFTVSHDFPAPPRRVAILRRLQRERRNVPERTWTDNRAASDSTASQCYKRIEDCTLNGMPCDGVNIVTDNCEDHFSWEQRFDVHGAYWKEAGGRAEDYYLLRNQLIAGILSQTPFMLTIPQPYEYSLCIADKC